VRYVKKRKKNQRDEDEGYNQSKATTNGMMMIIDEKDERGKRWRCVKSIYR